MKRKLFYSLMLFFMGTMLTGCHMSHEWADATCTEPRTCTVGGETEGEALGHTWVEATCEEPKHCSKCGETEGEALGHTLTEATYHKAATCTVCGKTEGEPKQTYFEEHGVEVADAPVACTVNVLIYNPDNPTEYQKTTDGTWEQIDCYSEPADEEGYQFIHLELCISSNRYYDAAQNISYLGGTFGSRIYDWYTGRILAGDGDDAFDYSDTLDIDGISYDVSYSKDLQWEGEDWVYNDSGDGTLNRKCYKTFTFKVPDGYDGLVFAAIPVNDYLELDTETAVGTEEESAKYAFDESYTEGAVCFCINKDGTVSERLPEDSTN